MSNRRGRTTSDPPARTAEPVATSTAPTRKPAHRESTARGFAFRLFVVLGLVLIAPGLHLRSLAPLCAVAGGAVAYGALCARERLDAAWFTAWDEAVGFLSVAWLAFRLF